VSAAPLGYTDTEAPSVQALLVPPLAALALYLGALYFLGPLYRRRQLYSQYLPVALAPSDEPGFVGRTRERIQDSFRSWAGDRIWHRRGSSVDTNFNFGDEELEEDLPSHHFQNIRDSMPPDGGSQRLSRDLEVGFLDDDPDDSQDDQNSQRRVLDRT
jgi:hypothetical protein